MITFIIAAIVIALIVVACGGGSGGGSNSSPATSPPPITRGDKVETGYFGMFDNESAETADHVSYVMPLDWGVWDRDQVFIQQRIIQQLQEAQAHGIKKAVVAVGFLTWSSSGNYALKGTQYLQVFRTQLEALGLLDMIEALYPIDEPDLAIKELGLTEAVLEQGLINVHTVFPEKHLMVIYGTHGGYPAQQFYDIVGKDDYGHGLVTMDLLPNQRLALVRGGADPYKEDPTPAVDYALAHPEVQYIVNFLYGDYSAGKGIRNNGMLPIYKTQGQRLL